MHEKPILDPSERPFKAIVEACQEGIVTVNTKGLITSANKAAHLLFGYERGDLKGRPVEELMPQSKRASHKQYRTKYEEEPTPRQMGRGRDLFALRKDGTSFPVEISLNRAHLYGEEHTVAFIIDITVRKEVEEALKRSEEQLIVYAAELEKRVQDRTHALEYSNTQLEAEIEERKRAEADTLLALEKERELNNLKSRFVSTASHEFRTPLSTILSSTSLIERYAAAEHEAKRAKHLGKIKKAIGHLNQILDDFLSISKLEEGKIDISTVRTDVKTLAQALLEELSPIKKAGQEIDLHVMGEPRTVMSDEKMLKNIGTNLLSNAIKYSPEGARIEVELDFGEEAVTWTFRDQGIGIPEADQKYLFDRFFRAQNAMNLDGTGLGLHIVKKYLELLNGSINFESKQNGGTTFIVTIPASYAEKEDFSH